MNEQLAPNLKGHRVLKIVHIVAAVVTLAYLALGIFGMITMWGLQPNIVGQITLIIALSFTTLGLYWTLSWFSCWFLGWFEIGMIQAGIWKDIRNEIASVVSFLVGLSCVTSAITWILER